MSSGVRLLLLTGNGRRHRYVASRLGDAFELAGVLYETKADMVAEPDGLSTSDREVIDAHFSQRDQAEHRLLGDPDIPDGTEVLEVSHGESNSDKAYEWVKKMNPDVVVLYGTAIIKPPLLTDYTGRMVNMHLGLSPYYRGSGTNFWPLVEGAPECVGVTIHLAVENVDAGAVLTQVRPNMETDDRAHEIGTRAVMAGAEAMIPAIKMHHAGQLQPASQDLSLGKVCRRRDFNADAVRTMWSRFDEGMVPDYLSDIERRKQKFPIVIQV